MKKAIFALCIFLASCGTPVANATPTPVPPSVTPTPVPATAKPVPSITPSATPYPTEITDAQGVTMRLVPAGEFTMGRENGNDDQKPAHQVYLDAFYMDIYEVTNALYGACVTAGGCTSPRETGSFTRDSYYGDSQYDNYPVIYVDWNQAQAYCEWRGDRLPTEAEWEKAARGLDGRTYPWGENISCDQANYNDCVGDTTEVGSYESGKSPYGMYDMAGNVWEWASDWFGFYDSISLSNNPQGPTSGQVRVERGGSWSGTFDKPERVQSVFRGYNSQDNSNYFIGFRCARSLP